MIPPVAQFTLDGKPCCVHIFGTQRPETRVPLFVMPVGGAVEEMMEGQHEGVDPVVDAGRAPPFVLASFEVADWENDLSPWKAPSIHKDHPDFAGNAPCTLEWVTSALLPALETHVPSLQGGPRGIVGYSMGGMFALWALHQSEVFTICGSCSGSLWYEGFVDDLEAHPPTHPCCIYMNLGMHEEKVRHRWFRQVGDVTRRAAALFEASPMVRESALKWYPGGHSGSAGMRIAQAQIWMARHLDGGSNMRHT